MATQIINDFTEYSFTTEELLSAAVFSDANILYLRTKLAKYAQQKINLAPEPEISAVYMQQEAELRGKIDMLRELIDDSQDLQRKLIDMTKEQ